MQKKVILITGATGGIGKETARALAKQGHTIIIHGRSREKAEAVKSELAAETGNSDIDILLADFLSLAEVARMADEFKERYQHLDVLVNNAGGQFGKVREVTKDGHEKTMTVNVFAPVLLSLLLSEELAKSEEGRIVTVSSASHGHGGKPYLNDIELKDHYTFSKVYGLSKLYIIWAMRRLAGELKSKGINNVIINCTHPGSAKTQLGAGVERPFIWNVIFRLWIVLMKTPAEGAESTIYAAISDEVKGISGKYFGPKGMEKVNETYDSKENETMLWDYCMKVCAPYLAE